MHFDLEQVMALPEGGDIGYVEREINGRMMRVPFIRPTGCFFVDDTTPLMWREADGSRWRLGRYSDGTWFKSRVY